MNIRHFFDNADEKTIDRITENYPLLNSKDKERLYAMSKKKYNRVQTENSPNAIEVSGVERYRKPVLHKVLSSVAAAVVVLGGIGGGVFLLGKGGGFDPMNDIEATQPSDEEATEATEVEETEAELEQVDYDYTAIATQLTDKLLELENIICYGDVSYNENDRKAFTVYTSDNSVYFDQYETIFYKVTDPRFTCRRDLYDELRSIFTKQRYDEDNFSKATIFNCDLDFYLGSELSDYIKDGKIDLAENFDNDDEYINLAVYSDVNGELYVRQCDFELAEYTSDVFIEVKGDERLLVKRKYKPVNADLEEIRNFEIVLENGEWKIDYVFNTKDETLENVE